MLLVSLFLLLETGVKGQILWYTCVTSWNVRNGMNDSERERQMGGLMDMTKMEGS